MSAPKPSCNNCLHETVCFARYQIGTMTDKVARGSVRTSTPMMQALGEGCMHYISERALSVIPRNMLPSDAASSTVSKMVRMKETMI